MNKVLVPKGTVKLNLMAKWTTRDGQTLDIRDMADSHLINTIRYLRRNAEALRELTSIAAADFAATTRGEMAEYYAWQAADELLECSDQDYLDSREDYREMLDEAKWRGLKV